MQAGLFYESTLHVTIGGVSVYKNSVAVVENNHVWQPLKHKSFIIHCTHSSYICLLIGLEMKTHGVEQ